MSADFLPVPFNRPFMAGRELEYIAEAVRLGHLAGDGPFTRRCQTWLEQMLGARKVLLTRSPEVPRGPAPVLPAARGA